MCPYLLAHAIKILISYEEVNPSDLGGRPVFTGRMGLVHSQLIEEELA